MSLYSRLLTLVTLLLMSVFNFAFSQQVKTDTITYILDLNKVPVNDRMITLTEQGPNIFYEIRCPCLEGNREIMLRSRKDQSKIIGKITLTAIKTVKLPELIAFIKANDSDEFDKLRIINFIENVNGKYHIRGVHYLGNTQHVMN